MKPAQGWLSWQSFPEAGSGRQESCRAWRGRPLALLLVLAALSGCCASRAQVKKNLMTDQAAVPGNQGVAEKYLVHWPDVLEISIRGQFEPGRICPMSLDGRIDLGSLGQPRVEGQTPPEIGRELAEKLGLRRDQVQVQVREYKSQQVFLFGQVVGRQRAVSYQGQETVLDLLQRVGGITQGASPEHVYVVRAHIGDSQRPEVFHVDLEAIVMHQDRKTNIRLEPYDQIYVGETRQSCLEKCLPPCVRPLFRACCGTPPPGPAKAR